MRYLYQSTSLISVKSYISNNDFTFAMLNTTDFNSKINRYHKAIFVRNPLSRFVSAYRDKIQNTKANAYRDKAKKIVKLYRTNATEEDIESGNATFLEFTRYVLEHQEDKDPYWYPVVKRLKPCLIPYDYIGKMETIETDSKHLFKNLQIEDLVYFPLADSQSGDVGMLSMLSGYYRTLTAEMFEKLIQLYESDFKVFGYYVPENQTDFRSQEDLIGI